MYDLYDTVVDFNMGLVSINKHDIGVDLVYLKKLNRRILFREGEMAIFRGC